MRALHIVLAIFVLISLTGCNEWNGSFQNQYSKKAYIANESIVYDSKENLKKQIAEKINQWQNETTIDFNVDDTDWEIPLNSFTFQINETIEKMEKETENPILVTINMDQIQENIKEKTNSTYLSNLNLKQIEKDLTSIASYLQTGNHSFDLNRYFIQKKSETVSSSSTIIPDSYLDFIQDWTSSYQEIEIPAGSIFSLNDYMSQSKRNFTDDEWSFLASSIYKTSMKSNFDILKRTTSRILPSYTTIGYDVKVSPNRLDFVFQNPNHYSYQLKFSIKENQFIVELFGPPLIYQYQIEIENLTYYDDEPIVYYDEEMERGSSFTRKNGIAATSASIYRVTLNEAGGIIEKELLTKDFYPAHPGEEVHGTAEPIEATDALETEAFLEDGESQTDTEELTEEELEQKVEDIVREQLENSETTPSDEVDE